MTAETLWYLGFQSEKVSSTRWVRELQKRLPATGVFSVEIPEWARRLARASEQGNVSDIRNRELRRVGVGAAGDVTATLHPSSDHLVAMKRFVRGYTPALLDDLPASVYSSRSMGRTPSEFDRLFSGVQEAGLQGTDSAMVARAVEVDNLQHLRRARDADAVIESSIQTPDLIDTGVLPSGYPFLRMTGLDVGQGSATREGAARMSRGLEALKQQGLGYHDIHKQNVFFRDSRGGQLQRPAILDWGAVSRKVEGTPYYTDVARKRGLASIENPIPVQKLDTGNSPVDPALREALLSGSYRRATPAQQRMIRTSMQESVN